MPVYGDEGKDKHSHEIQANKRPILIISLGFLYIADRACLFFLYGHMAKSNSCDAICWLSEESTVIASGTETDNFRMMLQ